MPDLPSPDAVAELLESRRTVQLFQERAVPRDVLIRGLSAARWAPNHRLTHPWRFYLLGPETVATVVALNTELTRSKLGERAAALKHDRWSAIPGWLVVTCVESEDAVRRQEDFAACASAVQNLLLYLWSHGIGSKWTTGDVTTIPAFWDAIGVSREREFLVGMIWYGYPAETPVMSRKPIDQFVHERP